MISCRALVCHSRGAVPILEEVEVDPPRPSEIRVKMAATGICHTDISCMEQLSSKFPLVAGHEAVAMVESIGKGITSVRPGDTVVISLLSNCGQCALCTRPGNNLCVLPPRTGGIRLKKDGKPLAGIMMLGGIGTFAEYSLVREDQVVQIDKNCKVPLEELALFGCCLPTGYGSVKNIAGLRSGSSCAIWGLGAVGLVTVMGCKIREAATIIAVDTNPAKFQLAQRLGATHVINPMDGNGKSVPDRIMEITGKMGVDYAFEAVGLKATLHDAMDSLARWGKCTLIGVTKPKETIELEINNFLSGKTLTSGLIGAYRIRDAVTELLPLVEEGKLDTKSLITKITPIDGFLEGLQALREGKAIRTVVRFD